MSEQGQVLEWMGELREAMKDPDVSIHLVQTFTHGRAVQVKIKTRKVGPLIFPPNNGGITDVLAMLGGMLDG